jgi:hypothetical protein
MTKFDVLQITEDEYLSLQSSGLGLKLFGASFPANINVYRTEFNKADVKFELYKAVLHFVNNTNADSEDIVLALRTLSTDPFEIRSNLENGMLTEDDLKELAEEFV